MMTSATLVQVTFPELRLVPSHLHIKTHKGGPTKRNLFTGHMLIDMARSHPKNVIAEFLRIGKRGHGGTNNNNLTELTRLCHLVPGRSRCRTVSGFTKLHPGKYMNSVKRRPLCKYGFNHLKFMMTSATLPD